MVTYNNHSKVVIFYVILNRMEEHFSTIFRYFGKLMIYEPDLIWFLSDSMLTPSHFFESMKTVMRLFGGEAFLSTISLQESGEQSSYCGHMQFLINRNLAIFDSVLRLFPKWKISCFLFCMKSIAILTVW